MLLCLFFKKKKKKSSSIFTFCFVLIFLDTALAKFSGALLWMMFSRAETHRSELNRNELIFFLTFAVTAPTKSTGIPSTSDRTSSLTPSITNTILPSASSSNGTPKTDNSSSTSLNTSSSTAVSKRTTMRTEAHSKTTLRTSTSNPTKATSTLIVSVSNSTEGDSGLSEEGQIAIIVVIIMGGAIGVTGVIAFISRRLKPRRKKLKTNNLDSPGNQYAGEFGRDIDEMSTYSNRSRSTVTFQVDNNRHWGYVRKV